MGKLLILKQRTTKKFVYPSWWTWIDAPITIWSNRRQFFTDFDVANYKNTGGKNIYVSPSGLSTNDGLTEVTAKNNLATAYTIAGDGDTIIYLDGIYKRPGIGTLTAIEKSINIIAKNKGKAIFIVGDVHVYTKTAEYTNIYQTTRSSTHKVIDISMLSQGVTKELKLVPSLVLCDVEEGTWYTDGVTCYVHAFGNKVPDNENTAITLQVQTIFYSQSNLSNHNLYLEGLVTIGGMKGSVTVENTVAYPTPSLFIKDCDFRYGFNLTSDPTYANGINVLGCEFVFSQNVKCLNARKDGFNYHMKNGTIPKFIEINCDGSGCGENVVGTGWTDNTYNGSTAHDGVKGIRINGHYAHNVGANVADVMTDTETLCLGCIAHNSASTDSTMYNSDFSTQQAGAKMLLENCASYGSLYSLAYYTGSFMYVKNTQYQRKVGGGSIVFS